MSLTVESLEAFVHAIAAVTIHAYSPPLLRAGAYSLGDDGELLRAARDGAVELKAEPAAV